MAIEFFNHLHVGDIQKYDNDLLISQALYFDGLVSSKIEPDVLSLAQANSSLAEIKEETLSLLGMHTNLIDTIEKYKTNFPDYISLIDKLQGSGTLDLTTFNALSTPSGSYTEIELWDSLIAQYILNDKLQLLELLQQAIKIYAIRTKIANATITTIEEVFEYWRQAFLVLPNPLFPLPFNEYTPPQAPPVDPPTVDPAYQMYTQLLEARTELIASFTDQIESAKLGKMSQTDFEASVMRGANEAPGGDVQFDTASLYNEYVNYKSPEYLDQEHIAALSRNSDTALQQVNVLLTKLSVPAALSIIDKELGTLLKNVSYSPKRKYVTNIGSALLEIDHVALQQIICNEETRLDHCQLIHQLNAENPTTSLIQVLGTGYVNVIRQELSHYGTGEVAHIENILKGESKSKSHRNLKKTETFVESFSSSTHESETDQRTSERFELNKTTSQVTSESTDLNAGVSVSASYGPVSVTAGLNYASSSASVEAQSQSVNTSKEITNRAVERIRETVEERRSTLTINEIEVINEHGIDNADGLDHINGFYYWVDKVYTQQVVNKGKRLMLEFMVPEPAAFHIFSKSTSRAEGVHIEKPIAPHEYTDDRLKTTLTSMDDITRDNYHFWGMVYGVQDLPIPPSDYETISNAFVLDILPEGKSWHDIAFNSLKVPAGYKADYGKLNVGFSSGSGRYIAGFLGNKRFSFSYGTLTPVRIDLDGERDLVPLSFRGHFQEYHMNVEIFCSLTPEKIASWKQQVYQSILSAYNEKRDEYENSLLLSSINAGISIEGDNPRANREIEKTELKKWGIEMLTLQRFGQFNAMKNAKNDHPEVHFNEAFEDGRFVKFFEQSIEWHNMTYIMYPYFWGRKQNWTITKQFDDADPLFTKFLQAGFARVVVPVHPKFTRAILHYLSSGEIWQGGDLPSLDDDLYLSITEEIKAAEDNTLDRLIGDPWEVTVPTNMVMLSSVIPPNLPGS